MTAPCHVQKATNKQTNTQKGQGMAWLCDRFNVKFTMMVLLVQLFIFVGESYADLNREEIQSTISFLTPAPSSPGS